MVQIRDAVEDLCHTVDIHAKKSGPQYDHLNLEEFLLQMGAGDVAMGTAKIWANAMLGCEAREVSALYFLDYCKRGGGLMQMRSDYKDGGQFLRVRTGKLFYQSHSSSWLIFHRNSILFERHRRFNDSRISYAQLTSKGDLPK